jgi:DNA-binding Xre family transcriptional regulator
MQVISYDGLEKALKDKHIGKTELATELGLSSRTVAKIGKGEKLSNRSIERIAGYLGVAPELLMKEVSDNNILQLLREEKELKLPGGL